jgi:hypothetical protein
VIGLFPEKLFPSAFKMISLAIVWTVKRCYALGLTTLWTAIKCNLDNLKNCIWGKLCPNE